MITRTYDWFLQRLPIRAIDVKSPSKVKVFLLVDTGAGFLEQIEFETSAAHAPTLKGARFIALAVKSLEENGTWTAMTYLLPGKLA